MKPQATPKPRDAPLERLDLRIELTHEEILADLRYPAPPKRMRRS